MEQTSPTSVYRYYDEHDVLVYVGITSRGVRRNVEHYKSKTWWPYVVRQEVEHYPDRERAATRETELIELHAPPYNTQQNAHALRSRQTYEAVRAKLPGDVDPWEMAQRMGRSLPLCDVTADGQAVEFATAAEHIPITSRLSMNGDAKIVHGSDVVGRVKALERRGPFVFITATVRRGIDRSSAVADLRMVTTKSGPAFTLRRIRV